MFSASTRMAVKVLFFHFLCFFLSISSFQDVEGSRSEIGSKPKKLFVFGDSYADTGNNPISEASSWKVPYGITCPGKPTGRYSDGNVLTDFVAKFLNIETPIAYRWRKTWGRSHVQNGINFAAGGTGVFDTLNPGPNMTSQIDSFQAILANCHYTKTELTDSVALATISGNDYSNYINTNGSTDGISGFIKTVVDQIEVNLKRIHETGVKKVVVAALQPLGCLPREAYKLSYKKCNATENLLVTIHNVYLQAAVKRLNAQSNCNSSFLILDLNKAFSTVFKQNNQLHKGNNQTFVDQYKNCCVGTTPESSCGDVDAQGKKMYAVCANPGSSFFWDHVHPTQAGWEAVCSTPAVQNTLNKL